MSPKKLVPEGIEGRVPYKGPASATCCSRWSADCAAGWATWGAATIDELRTETEFVRITAAGLRESHPHDVMITQRGAELLGLSQGDPSVVRGCIARAGTNKPEATKKWA